MAIKKAESTAEETIVSLTTDTAPPHTDLENDLESNPSEGAMETTTVSEQISQTESNDDSLSAAGIEDALNSEEKPIYHQTGNEANESNQNSNDSAEEILDNSENPEDVQIDSEKPKRSRRRRKLPEENQIQSDSETKAEPDEANDGVEKASKSKIRIPTPKSSAILSIDDELGVITDADKARNELLDLLESYRGKKHLSGSIQGIENPSGDPSKTLAVLYYGEYKVIIPLAEAVEPPEDLKGQPLDYVLNYMLNKRLGAEVDYIIKGIDAKEKIAVGSRIEAMRNKRKTYYFGTDRDGNNLLYPDLCAEVRVVSVVRSGIFVDLFGLEVFIPLRELSYQRLMDAEKYFTPGQRTLVKILDIDRTDRRNIKVRASVKQAGENPYDKALKKYSVGNRYVGTVIYLPDT